MIGLNLYQSIGITNPFDKIRVAGDLISVSLAPAAEHIAHLLAWALQNNMHVEQMLEMPFYHPVIEEGLRTALLDAESQLQ